MVRNCIYAGAGCDEQSGGFRRFIYRAGTEDHHLRHGLLHKSVEYPEVASVCGRVVASRQAADRGEIGLVHEFGGSDVASDVAGKVEKATRLIRGPDASRVAIAGAHRE